MLDKEYWNQRWIKNETQWDIGSPSSPLLKIIRKWKDKNSKILIPGCGNAYEIDFLLENGFTNITVLDFAEEVIITLKNKYKSFPQLNIIQDDFFTHAGSYDYILEQTFFCSLPKSFRQNYAEICKSLLNDSGILTGVLFDREFEYEGPPFGGNMEEYEELFSIHFSFVYLEKCDFSIPQRMGSEVYFICKK